MSGIKDILDAYNVVYSDHGAVTRVEVVDMSKNIHLVDPAKGIVPWHGYVDVELPNEAVEQVMEVRKSLLALDPGLPDGKYTIPKFVAEHCTGRRLFFTEQKGKAIVNTLVAEIDAEVKAVKDSVDLATDAREKEALRKVWLQTMAFKHLMHFREGPLSAVNTYDGAIITWGMGWAISGSLGRVIAQTYKVENEKEPDADKHHFQKLFYLAGFLYNQGTYYVVDTVERTVRRTNAAGVGASVTAKGTDPSPDNAALRLLHDTHELHIAWALLTRDDLTRATMTKAQLDIFKASTGDVPQSDKIKTAALYTFVAHLQHWTGSTFDVVAWATGPSAKPARVTQTLPSEKGDAELAVQAVHLFYSRKGPNLGQAVFTQPRDYWRQMTGEDAREEGLVDFNPSYDMMTAPPVGSVPVDHLKAVVDKDGTTYDLGPLDDFDRAGPPGLLRVAPTRTQEELDSQLLLYLPNQVNIDRPLEEYDPQAELERQQREQQHEQSSFWSRVSSWF